MPVQAVLGASAVEFRLCRPKSKQTRQDIKDFPEYAELPLGRAMMTLEYCTGHLHARYEWVAEELRQAVVERFPEVKVRCFSSSSTFFPAPSSNSHWPNSSAEWSLKLISKKMDKQSKT